MIRGTKRALEKRPSIKVDLNASIHNRFDIEVVDTRTGEVRQLAQAENVICDTWWTNISSSYVSYIAFGSGAGTPSPADTSLFNRIGQKSVETTKHNKIDKVNHVFSITRSIRLLESEYVGLTLTEVGLSNSGGSIVTHAMMQDMNGNPVSIVKTDTDIINIYATVFAHWQPTYNDGAIVVSAEVCEWNSLFTSMCSCDFPSGQIRYETNDRGVVYEPPSSKVVSTTRTYDAATHSSRYVAERVPVGSWNVEYGIPVLYFGSTGSNGSYADPKRWGYPMLTFYPESFMPDANIEGEAVGTGDGVTVDFKTKFSPAYDIEVLVDGVPATDVTVGNNLPAFGDRIGRAFKFMPSESATQSRGSSSTEAYGHGTFDSDLNTVNTRMRGVHYNPYYQYGVKQLIGASYGTDTVKVEVSDDLKTWFTIYEGQNPGTIDVPEEYQNSKYWAVTNAEFSKAVSRDIPSTNIHFSTPPAEGAVIVANYKAKCLPKDENHVFDFEFTIRFGEYNSNA